MDGLKDWDLLRNEERTPEADALVRPLEIALADLPQARVRAEDLTRLRNGNPAPAIATDAEYGDLVWVADGGKAVAVGIYKAGNLHPVRVFNH